jgi:hypothetical protein
LAEVKLAEAGNKHHHHHHHHHHKHGHHKHHKKDKASVGANGTDTAKTHEKSKEARMQAAHKPAADSEKAEVSAQVAKADVQSKALAENGEGSIISRMKQLEAKLSKKQAKQSAAKTQGHLLVNGPLPADFNALFARAVGIATGSDAKAISVTKANAVEDSPGIVDVSFAAAPQIARAVELQAGDPDSRLATGNLHSFLVAKSSQSVEADNQQVSQAGTSEEASQAAASVHDQDVTPVQEKGIDIDTQMPYGDLEPFGREDTAQELTESSVRESDGMVDQLERAEVAEEKRAVFRALTRLRGAAITSFDGVARSQTGNIDEYNKVHKWRNAHPLHHLADEESDISKWAFPDNADF